VKRAASIAAFAMLKMIAAHSQPASFARDTV